MDESGSAIPRRWLVMIVGTVLFAGGLLALCFPVFLDSYDRWGVQVKCGNGYYTKLLQATVAEQGQDQQSSPAGQSAAVRPASNYVDQCESALGHRRAWLIPVTTLGGLILIGGLVTWARGESSSSPASSSAAPVTPTDVAMRWAMLLGRVGSFAPDWPLQHGAVTESTQRSAPVADGPSSGQSSERISQHVGGSSRLPSRDERR